MIILSLVAIFFVGYYFYYLPANRDILHKNGFLILQKIQQNIKDRNDYLQTSFINILKENQAGETPKTLAQLQKQLDNYKLGGKVFEKKGTTSIKENTGIAGVTDVLAVDADSSVYLSAINRDSLLYKRSNTIAAKSNYQVTLPFQRFVQPLLLNQRTELFESYLVIGDNTGVVYIDPDLAINPGIAKDSLVAKNKQALFSGTKDIVVNGTDYKMFYYPFKLGPEYFQLCGFLKSDTYFNKLRQVPVAFVYPIVIALLLLIMLLPIVKFFLMGKDEHVRYSDFVFGLVSIFAGTGMLTLIVIQVLLLWAADLRTGKNLKDISSQIDNNFTGELARAYNQLDRLDSLVDSAYRSGRYPGMLDQSTYNALGLITGYFQRCKNDTACYYNFNRISWINQEGDQYIKADIDTGALVFANVRERTYFKTLKNNEGYALPGIAGSACVIEPINSWTNGDFSLMVSRKSRLGNGAIVAMSVQMPSVMQTILPPGFGFCIIDNDGGVLLHSDMSRNLQENFISKTDPSRAIKEAVKSRQAASFNDINLYGKNNSLFIQPVEALPFHLVTFYDNGYIVPVNMRIFTFALLFCLISSAICILLWFGVFRRRNIHSTYLYDPMHYLKWVVPKEKNLRFYALSTFFMLVYLLVQVAMIFLSNAAGISNYTILILMLLLPVNIFAGLFVINYRVKRNHFVAVKTKQLPPNPYNALAVLFAQPVAVLIAYGFSMSEGYGRQSAFLFFELFFFIFLCLFFLLPKGSFHFLVKNRFSYLYLYCVFSTLLLICLSVLPAAVYTWYAHNQEITQSVKKGQLYLANALQQRVVPQFNYVKKRNALGIPAGYFDKLQYQRGIYSIYKDAVYPASKTELNSNNRASYEKFYFSIANQIGNNYYDPLLIPALRDTATGNAWYWSTANPSVLSFWYTMYNDPEKRTSAAGADRTALKITSAYPERYEFVVVSFKGFMLLLVVAGFVYGLYLMLRFMSGQLFLRKFIAGNGEENDIPAGGISVWFQQYQAYREENDSPAGPVHRGDVDRLLTEYDYFRPVKNEKEFYRQEIAMINAQEKYRDFYFFIWDKCNPGEKYLLLDFAQNGFANFKNTGVIHGLLRKGIFIILNEEIKLFSVSFRAFVLSQKRSREMTRLQKEFQHGSAWQAIRMPLLISLLGVAFFIFFTQEQTFQKITALVAGISTILSLLLKFFTDGAGLFSTKK